MTNEMVMAVFSGYLKRIALEEWIYKWLMALANLESGNGRSIPEGSNNPIGMHAGPGDHAVVAKEAGTGREIRYRKFDKPEHAAASLNYLVEQSRLKGYAMARERYENHMKGIVDARRDLDNQERAARALYVLEFSRVYCPVDPEHGNKILRLMKSTSIAD